MAGTGDAGQSLCYNRGCGKMFDPNTNREDSCRYHPGEPFFHDAYKGWSCCNRKCIDFTEFLNIKGCAVSFHNPVKPPEPEKPKVDKSKADEIIEYKSREAKQSERLPRPPLDTPMMRLIPTIAPSLKQQQHKSEVPAEESPAPNSTEEIAVGTPCKNKGCKATYTGNSSDNETCVHHPGYPIFHEGLKYWSCCQRRTTEFSVFLEQVGCAKGSHVWTEDKSDGLEVQCRHDWHQTASHVCVAIYAKNYDPDTSYVEINPIRLVARLDFGSEGTFLLDQELEGIVSVNKSSVNMMGTKVEVKLKKAEASSWRNLAVPQKVECVSVDKVSEVSAQLEEAKVDVVDLNDL